MKITIALIEKLIRLTKGESLPASVLRGEWFEQMLSDGILITITKGSRKSYRACDEKTLREYVATGFDIRNLEAYHALLKDENASRAEQVKVAGNSKAKSHRTFSGFLVNCYEPIAATLGGKTIEISPKEGTYVFISDFRTFAVPDDVIIVGIENAENFRYIRQQQWLFEAHFPQNSKLLFVSRYPQEQSCDLREWLLSIPNQYVHFGDLDLAGIHIYLSEYYRYLGKRASFLIPEDYERRIAQGSRERYDDHYSKYGQMEIADSGLEPLVACIHRFHRGYDQEGFISDKGDFPSIRNPYP